MKITKIYDMYWECYEWINSEGQFHREDGPAVEYNNGTKHWYYHGKYISCKTQQEFEKLIKLQAFW